MENNSNHMSKPAYRQQMENQQIESVPELNRDKIPIKRIKGIVKLDLDVGMVSPEGQIILSKACEKFIAHLTMRSWLHADENKSCTLQRSDIFAAVSCTSTFDFLVKVLHRDESVTGNPSSVAMPNLTVAASVRERLGKKEDIRGESEV